MKHSGHGFTLLEMLIALIIVALLASQAYPVFQQYVTRVRRQQAQSALLRLMQQEERYFTQANTYLAFSSSSTGARRFITKPKAWPASLLSSVKTFSA